MSGDYFWNCVEALSATFDGSPNEVEAQLALYEMHCQAMPKEKRAELRRQLIQIIGGLSQLQMRLA